MSKLRFPAFKFLRSDHARDFLDHGRVYLPALSSFRDTSAHGGLIGDDGEGQLHIENRYPYYCGLAKDAAGVLPLHYHPYHLVNAFDLSLKATLDSDEHCKFAYCLTQYFLSHSLDWAIGEASKDTCVMITDVEEFARRVSRELATLGINYVGTIPVSYDVVDNERLLLEQSPTADSISNGVLANPHLCALVKPKRYDSQLELRVLWHSRDKTDDHALVDVEPIKDLLIPIDYTGVDQQELSKGSRQQMRFGLRAYKADGSETMEFEIGPPFEMVCPVLLDNQDGGSDLGFLNQTQPQNFSNVDVKHAKAAVTMTNDGIVFSTAALDDIHRIEFYHVK